MEFIVEEEKYPIIIKRKNNKNTYIRVNNKLEIIVTTSYYTTDSCIIKLIKENKKTIEKMLKRQKKEKLKEEQFYYLGIKYDIIIVPTMDHVEVNEGRIFTKNQKMLDRWYQREIETIFTKRLEQNYKLFKEKIPYPTLKLRKMKTRWGVCNKKKQSITLNINLMRESIECLDYVIVHELSHFVHFNHSKEFWDTVSKYCNNYKEIRKKLKE